MTASTGRSRYPKLENALAKPQDVALYCHSRTETKSTDLASREVLNNNMTSVPQTKSTLVYDGECPFCRKWVTRIGRRDRNGTLELVARQTEGLTERFPKLDEADFNTGMRLITPDNVIHVGADAAYQIARRLPFWRRIAWLYRVPGIHWLTRAGYAWIAARRQSLAGKCDDETCEPK